MVATIFVFRITRRVGVIRYFPRRAEALILLPLVFGQTRYVPQCCYKYDEHPDSPRPKVQLILVSL